MRKSLINKGRMYVATDLSLDKFADTFAGNEELNEARRKLKDGLNSIGEVQQVLVVDNTGLTQYKYELRTGFTLHALKFAVGLKAYATTQKDTALLTKVSYQLTDFNRLPDPILFDVVTMLYRQADPIRDKLVRFFLTDEDFASMEKMLADFKGAFPQKRMATTVSKSSVEKIIAVFKSMDKLLKEVIDRLVAPYQYQNPDFYREYCNARIIVGYTGRGKSKPGPESPQADKA